MKDYVCPKWRPKHAHEVAHHDCISLVCFSNTASTSTNHFTHHSYPSSPGDDNNKDRSVLLVAVLCRPFKHRWLSWRVVLRSWVVDIAVFVQHQRLQLAGAYITDSAVLHATEQRVYNGG